MSVIEVCSRNTTVKPHHKGRADVVDYAVEHLPAGRSTPELQRISTLVDGLRHNLPNGGLEKGAYACPISSMVCNMCVSWLPFEKARSYAYE